MRGGAAKRSRIEIFLAVGQVVLDTLGSGGPVISSLWTRAINEARNASALFRSDDCVL